MRSCTHTHTHSNTVWRSGVAKYFMTCSLCTNIMYTCEQYAKVNTIDDDDDGDGDNDDEGDE